MTVYFFIEKAIGTPIIAYFRVIQVTVFFNLSLTGTKKTKNDKTQPFLFGIYVDILIF